VNVSSSSALEPRESPGKAAPVPAPSHFAKNPTYPQRTHLGERKQLEDSLHSWTQKFADVEAKLTALSNHPARATHERLYHQMQGALDQMAEAVRRMPLESGSLYKEDRERYEAAEAALRRLCSAWDAAKP
jgi:hypothetical protein